MNIIPVNESVFIENITFDEKNSFLIANNTYNTWQKERGLAEKIRDTKQGKVAEQLVKYYIESNSCLSYIEYDDIRKDFFKKHAPFDGLLYKKNNVNESILIKCISKINEDVANSSGGMITSVCRKLLNDNNIATVEIKSTKINDNKKELAKKINLQNKNERECILQAIKNNDDFLTYLHFCRFGNFSNFSEYCSFVKSKHIEYQSLSSNELFKYIKEIELKNLSDIHIRVYIDYVLKNAIIIGFVEKEVFLKEPIIIKKMVKYGKSEGAVYLTKPLKIAKPIASLEKWF